MGWERGEKKRTEEQEEDGRGLYKKRRIGRGIEEENRTEDRSEEWKSISKYM